MVIVLFFSFVILSSSVVIYANWFITGDYRMKQYLYRIWISAFFLISLYVIFYSPFHRFFM
ncbi:Uncharacterised protein [Sphingobacterium mizutaii]|uniref:Uncharacterized protein n=1 Tax=Sphingobacterium mizutaii TaxID=1010 RepID=A0AAJ4XD13_9SPHI|nr:hypothetical protein SAMN05192578_1011221 [Sphingobacterium mizutaii]SNV51283.1 Uncharacterised protein [Sphingobacterium mizutaii]